MTDKNDLGIPDIRALILQVVDDLTKQYGILQSGSVLQEASRRLNRRDLGTEQKLLTSFYDLFRSGYLSWGYNLSNSDPPFFHVTSLGRQALAIHSRDPSNSDGYLAHLKKLTDISRITNSYITEALHTYNTGCFKATAVMVGAAAESLVLEIRDILVEKLESLGQPAPNDLTDWRLKHILDAIQKIILSKKGVLPKPFFERLEANWPAFTHQIRTARNDAGHPVTVEPVTPEEVHGSLLIFLELATLAKGLEEWIRTNFSCETQ